MTPLDLIRERIEACFIFCSYAAPEIRLDLGVKHLSQVWTKLSSWYIWLDETPGAFMLELRGGAQFSMNGSDCQGAVGVIRYFPPADQGAALSSEEAALLQSGAFDETGTPYWEKLVEIGGSELFVVGTFELHALTESDDLFFLFEASERNQTDNPGVQLFDRLVGMQAYASQLTPLGPFVWGRGGRAAAVGSNDGSEQLLRSYLGTEQLSAVSGCDMTAQNWSALAERKPVAAEGSGCCCCCH
jgi:hypothetical protein